MKIHIEQSHQFIFCRYNYYHKPLINRIVSDCSSVVQTEKDLITPKFDQICPKIDKFRHFIGLQNPKISRYFTINCPEFPVYNLVG